MILLSRLEDVVPTKGTTRLNANGNVSVFGKYKGQKVKLYQPFTPKQIKLRLKVQESHLGGYFPRIIEYDDTYIIEEFVHRMDRAVDGNTIVKLMMALRKMEATPDFHYLKHIYARIGKRMPEKYERLPWYVNHNDLTRDNILIDTQGVIKIIDNEMLGCNTGWVLNLFNGTSNLFTHMSGIDKLAFYEDFNEHEAKHLFHNVRKKWKKP